MKKVAIVFLFIFFLCASIGFCADKIKYYSTSSGLMYFRVTNIIYNDSILMDTGARKRPTQNNTFAQIMINFANLTDKPIGKMGLHPTKLDVDPSKLYLVGKSGKYYSGMNATKFLRSELKPFTQKRTLEPGEDIVVAMAFHVPKNDRIAGVIYKFPGGMTLNIDYSNPPQMEK